MKKGTSSTAEKPTTTEHEHSSNSDIDKSFYQRNLYIVMMLNMTWQLAIVVTVPVVGGKYLDDYFGTAPALLIAGGVIALLGVIGVMMRIVSEANRRTGNVKSTDKDKK